MEEVVAYPSCRRRFAARASASSFEAGRLLGSVFLLTWVLVWQDRWLLSPHHLRPLPPFQTIIIFITLEKLRLLVDVSREKRGLVSKRSVQQSP